MGADVVVPMPEGSQISIELLDACDDPLVEHLFESAEEALDSSVLPRASGIIGDRPRFPNMALVLIVFTYRRYPASAKISHPPQ